MNSQSQFQNQFPACFICDLSIQKGIYSSRFADLSVIADLIRIPN